MTILLVDKGFCEVEIYLLYVELFNVSADIQIISVFIGKSYLFFIILVFVISRLDNFFFCNVL